MAKPNATALAVVSQDTESYAAPVDYSREQIQLIKDTYAKGASDAELALFIEIAKRKGLDIFSKQICLIARWDRKLGREVRDPQTTIDGYRLIAERTGRYVPGRDTVYQYQNDHILCATAFIKKLVAGEWHEIAATAFFNEYQQTNKDGTLNATWNKMPHVMIAKCAESLALRKAFPAELSGIYTQEEMGSEVIYVKPEPAPALKASPRQTVEALSERITKVEGGYDCDAGDEVHAIRKDAEGIFCSCGSRGNDAQCIHRLALKLWTARQAAAAPAPEPEPEPEDVEGEVVDPQEPLPSQKHALSKAEFIAFCELTRELERVGVTEEEWRATMERISGHRSRRTITAEHLARVIFAFNKKLEAAERKGHRK